MKKNKGKMNNTYFIVEYYEKYDTISCRYNKKYVKKSSNFIITI